MTDCCDLRARTDCCGRRARAWHKPTPTQSAVAGMLPGYGRGPEFNSAVVSATPGDPRVLLGHGGGPANTSGGWIAWRAGIALEEQARLRCPNQRGNSNG